MGESEPALGLREAAAVVARAAAFEEPLRRRAEGVTWMVWGFATASVMFMGVAFGNVCTPVGVSVFSEDAYRACQPWIDWIWVPWLLAALAGTKAVWHIAALSVPKVGPGWRRALLSVLLVVPLAGGAFGLVHRLLPDSPESAMMFFAFGTPWLVLGLANLHRGTLVGRRVMAFIGLAMILAGLAWLPLAAGLPHEGWMEASFVGGTLASGLPIATGLWQTLRG